jgi:hypothetical protein
MIEIVDYKIVNGNIFVTVDTDEEKRPYALFEGTYEIEPIEEDRFSYGLSSHYTETVGYWVTFSVTRADYIDENGYEIENFDYDAQDIDEIDYYLNDIFEQDGDL